MGKRILSTRFAFPRVFGELSRAVPPWLKKITTHPVLEVAHKEVWPWQLLAAAPRHALQTDLRPGKRHATVYFKEMFTGKEFT